MSEQPSRFKNLVADAKQRVKEVTIDEIRRRIDQGENVQLIDVREESEWAQGHLPGAAHLSKGALERDIEKRFPETSTELVLYCGGGSRSALAADNLQKMGYNNVLSLIGGFKSWRTAGYPLET